MKEEVYISVDIEAAGPIPGEYSLLSIGASIVGQSEVAFYAELKPLNDNAVPEALAVSKLDMKNLAATGKEAMAAMEERPILEEERQFWSFRPVARPTVPAVKNAWVKNEIDAFVWEGLQKKGLKPSAQASKRVLIRRAYLDFEFRENIRDQPCRPRGRIIRSPPRPRRRRRALRIATFC